MTGTALGVNSGKSTRTITFKNEAHKKFYMEYLQKCRYQDVYHKALVYCLGLNSDTRDHVDRIYDFKEGYVKPECLYEGWQTSGSMKVVRMAYNLYCNGTPSVLDIEDAERKLEECSSYTVEDFFAAAMQDIFGRQLKSVIRNTASIRIGRICMLKIRLQGTTNDIKWFKKILERDKRINVLDVSEPYANKGTKKYFRVYAEVEKNRQ